MTNGAILILSLITVYLAAPFTLSDRPNIAFPEFPQKVTFINKQPSDIGSSSSTASASINQIINSWSVKIDDGSNQNTSPIEAKQVKSKGCAPKVYSFKQKINDFTRVDFDPNNLLPGNLLQMVNRYDFSKGIVTAFTTDNKRNPLYITLLNGLNDSFTIPTLASFGPKLKQILQKNTPYLNNQPIQIYVEQAINIETVLRNLGLSTQVYQELLIAGFTAQKVQFNEGRMVVAIYQKLFSASIDLTKNGTQTKVNLVDAVFSPLYTYDEFMQTSSYGYWGTGNLPQLVTQTNFGRLLVLSMDNSLVNQRLVDQMKNCFMVKGQPSEACIDLSISQIQRSGSARFYVAGVDAASVIERNNRYPVYREYVSWKRIFSNFDSPKSIDNLRPLSAKLTDLLGNKFTQTDTRYFSVLKCGSIPDISIKIKSVEGECKVQWKGNKDKDFNKVLFITGRPETFDIGATTQWQPFELKFILKGKKRGNFVSNVWSRIRNSQQYRSKLQFSILINGVQRFINTSGNSRGNQQTTEAVFKVDPMKATVR